MRKKLYLSITGHQLDITIGLLIMKTTTNTCKNQNFNRKVLEASVEAIETIRVSLKTKNSAEKFKKVSEPFKPQTFL